MKWFLIVWSSLWWFLRVLIVVVSVVYWGLMVFKGSFAFNSVVL